LSETNVIRASWGGYIKDLVTAAHPKDIWLLEKEAAKRARCMNSLVPEKGMTKLSQEERETFPKSEIGKPTENPSNKEPEPEHNACKAMITLYKRQ
jgi:hypothetical protein